MKPRLSFALCAFVVALSGCNKSNAPARDGYPLGIDDAYHRLLKSDFAGFVADRQCGVLIHVRRSDNYPFAHKVKWTVTSSEREMFNFSVALTAVDATHTKAAIEVSREDDGHEAYDTTYYYARPAVDQPVRPAIEEQVAADLTGRAFNSEGLPHRDGVCDLQRRQLEGGQVFNVYEDLTKLPNSELRRR